MQAKHYLPLALLLAALAGCQTSPEVVVPESSPQARARVAASIIPQRIEILRKRILATINSQRKAVNQADLSLNSKLLAVAQKHTEYLVVTNFRGYSLDKQKELNTRVVAEGYIPGTTAGLLLLEGFNHSIPVPLNGTDPNDTSYDSIYIDRIMNQYNSLNTFDRVLRSYYYKEIGVGISYNATQKAFVFSIIIAGPK